MNVLNLLVMATQLAPIKLDLLNVLVWKDLLEMVLNV